MNITTRESWLKKKEYDKWWIWVVEREDKKKKKEKNWRIRQVMLIGKRKTNKKNDMKEKENL